MKYILASASPRRKELLKNINILFECIASNVCEIYDESLSPEEVVKYLAKIKAQDIFNKLNLSENDSTIVIGCDTVVAVDGIILGKPIDKEDLLRMITLLKNKHHYVMTGVSLISKDINVTFCEKTKVYFDDLTIDEINDYLKDDSVYDKAGGYAIQEKASIYISKIEGCYYNVMGLPLNRIKKELSNLNLLWKKH